MQDYQLLVESIKDYALFMLNASGEVESWNEGARSLKGYKAEEIIGSHFSRFYTPEDLGSGLPAAALKVASETGRYEAEGWRVRKDGTQFWGHVVITAIRDDAGALRGFAKVTRDLTERHEAEELHRRADEQFRLLVERVEDYAIFMLDPQGRVATWNVGAQKIKGYSEKEILGKRFDCFYTAEDCTAGKPQKLLDDAVRNGHVHDTGPRVRKDGTTFQSDVVITAIYDKHGVHRGYAKVTRDVTEQIERAQLEQSKALAESANRAKDHFIAVLSHELRTPLTPVLASVSYLQGMPNISDELRVEFDAIRRNVDLEVRLIDDLLDLTSISRAKLKLRQEAADLVTIVHSAAAIYAKDIASKSLVFEENYDVASTVVWADASRLRQVFWNLLGNAVKFTPTGGRISIRMVHDTPGKVRVEISDSGIGIAPELLPKVFNAFEQGETAGHYRTGGLGLGLTISKALVEMHRGTIAATSAGPGLGTTFTVTLSTISDPVQPSKPRPTHAPAKKASRILLVEDHPDTLRVMSSLLTNVGYAVTTAKTVREAKDVISHHGPFDLLVSDIGLPDGSGWDIMRTVRETKPFKGIALSGFGAEDDVRKSLDAGFVDHLIKPVDFASLQKTIEKLVA